MVSRKKILCAQFHKTFFGEDAYVQVGPAFESKAPLAHLAQYLISNQAAEKKIEHLSLL